LPDGAAGALDIAARTLARIGKNPGHGKHRQDRCKQRDPHQQGTPEFDMPAGLFGKWHCVRQVRQSSPSAR
jgi:hypothetical protein